MKKDFRIISLDISASSTGWAFLYNRARIYRFGTITTNKANDLAMRLTDFRHQLKSVISDNEPNIVLIEDTFVGKNPKVNKLLSKFGGVAEQLCYEMTGAPPIIISNKTVKAFFKVKKKEKLFEVISSLLNWPEEYSFKHYNDVADAVAQLMYYMQLESYRIIKEEKPYGFKYI